MHENRWDPIITEFIWNSTLKKVRIVNKTWNSEKKKLNGRGHQKTRNSENSKKTIDLARKMNCKMPKSLIEMFEGLDSDPETRKLVAASIVYDQCKKLIEGGIRDLHFYTLNRADLSFAICHILGIRTLKWCVVFNEKN